MSELVRIAEVVGPWPHKQVTSNMRIQEKLAALIKKGFDVNLRDLTARNGNLVYYFIPEDRKLEKLSGSSFHDVISNDSSDERRIRNDRIYVGGKLARKTLKELE